MNIEPFYDTRTSTLTYVVYDPESQDAVIIDPVLDYEPKASKTWTDSVDRVVHFVRENGLKPHYILETHAHADHLSGAQRLKLAFPRGQNGHRRAHPRRPEALSGHFWAACRLRNRWQSVR